MSNIFVCPKCNSVSKTNTRCYSGTFCDRDHGEERQEYSLVEKSQTSNPFKVGDLVVWKNMILKPRKE